MTSFICAILKKINEQTKPNRNKHVNTENSVVVTRGEEGGIGKGELTIW